MSKYPSPAAYVLAYRERYNETLERYKFKPNEYAKELVEVSGIIENKLKTIEPEIYDQIMRDWQK